MIYDALIVGAGPAGSATARQLARAGWSVLLIDREPAGRDRVCGGFIGPEAARLWPALGVTSEIRLLPAAPVDAAVFSGARTGSFEAAIPGGGIVVSRAGFDRWMAAQAEAAGADFRPQTTVASLRRMDRDGCNVSGAGSGAGAWQAQLRALGRDEIVAARHLIRAHGRRQIARAEPSTAARLSIGCKTIYEGISGLDRRVGLYFVRGGHVGVSHVGVSRLDEARGAAAGCVAARFTVCCYVEQARMRGAGGGLDRMMEQMAGEHPHLAQALRSARRVADWAGCPAEPDGREVFFEDGAFHVGDAVTMMNTIIGGGLAMAIGSAVLLARAMLDGRMLDGGSRRRHPRPMSERTVADAYARAWRRQFGARVRFGRWLGWCERSPLASQAMLRLVASQPILLNRLVRFSRPALKIA